MQCDRCKTWRKLPPVVDVNALPESWHDMVGPAPRNMRRATGEEGESSAEPGEHIQYFTDGPNGVADSRTGIIKAHFKTGGHVRARLLALHIGGIGASLFYHLARTSLFNREAGRADRAVVRASRQGERALQRSPRRAKLLRWLRSLEANGDEGLRSA